MRNSSLIERSGIENFRALSVAPKLRVADLSAAVQEHSSGAVAMSRDYGGASGRENVGMSNDKTSAKLVRRKPKGFCSTLIGTELVGT